VKITAREKKYIIIGSAVVAVILIFYAVMKLMPDLDALASDLENNKAILMRQRDTLSKEAYYRSRLERYKRNLEQAMTRFLSGDNPSVAGAELQKILTDFAGQSGVEILQKSVQPEKNIQEGIVKVSVAIETNCDLDQLVQFLTAVHNYEKSLTVDELVINSYRMQKKYEIRPRIIISGYISSSKAKTG
jgi:hypothetical protein